MIAINLFGRTHVSTPTRVLLAEGFPGVKPRQLLELLALGRGAAVPKSLLAEQLWEGRPPDGWSGTLESYVAVLRRTLEPGRPGRRTVVATTPRGYRLDLDRVTLDLISFDRLIATAVDEPPGAALPRWEAAVRLGRRRLLEDEPYPAWAVQARAVHAAALVTAAQRGAADALAVDLPGRAVPLADVATRADPLAEGSWQLLISALHRAGRRAEAVHAFRSCRLVLRRELGLHPGPATRRLHEAVLAERSEPIVAGM